MKPIIKKATVNKANKQMNISIPKKSLPSNLRYSDNLFFRIEAFKKDKEVKK
jgi:hypothetical protein